jgi:hypothetical protein
VAHALAAGRRARCSIIAKPASCYAKFGMRPARRFPPCGGGRCRAVLRAAPHCYNIHEGAERRRASAAAEERKLLEAVARAGEAPRPRHGAARSGVSGRAGLGARRHAHVSAARCRSGSGVDEETGGTPGAPPAPRGGGRLTRVSAEAGSETLRLLEWRRPRYLEIPGLGRVLRALVTCSHIRCPRGRGCR